ncbi:cyclodeaminase/cyclohydrolase family protein [Amycolatopsis cihanbeyliensis]|uniref:Formiminotetrahydrofolate cyclodeaminase n=1 Tax=Amycolatopsis cihanbeyliensis TaxID=1128664 RepID=A0A542DEA3_AMYCI|nr:cyclodeaminase/cyclohydrolase family protein [Amycolatopsis cihanbeyliensis]TQJ01399.1 formiminotetrahydrofolate cyclodeaminase [Amycolatopsis cihanbeyliensis]
MSTLDRPLRDYLAEVAAPTPSSTGGSVCAMTVAAAAGLVAMSAGVSRTLDDSQDLAKLANALHERAAMLIEADTRAYRAVGAAQRLDPDGPERSTAIRDALVAAAQPPLRVAHLATEVASLAALLVAQGNPVVRADAITAANLAASAARSAAVLVRTNLRAAGLDDGASAEAEAAATSAERSAHLVQSCPIG